MITAGIGCGTRNTRAVVVKEGEVAGRAAVPTGSDPRGAARECLSRALRAACLEEAAVERIAVTGAGAGLAGLDAVRVGEAEAAAVAGRLFSAECRTVLDVGSSGCFAVRLSPEGRVRDTVAGGECAAGAGIYIEIMARRLGIDASELGAEGPGREIPINAQCAVFAEREAAELIEAGYTRAEIGSAVMEAMAGRIVSTVLRMDPQPEVVMIGGPARNPALVEGVRRGLRVERILVPDFPEYAAAGAVAGKGEETFETGPGSEKAPGRFRPLVWPVSAGVKPDPNIPTGARWRDPDLDPEAAAYVSAGVDTGSVCSKACLVADGRVLAWAVSGAGPDGAAMVLGSALEAAGVSEDRLGCIVGTGYGRVNIPFADRTVTETACHARGASFIHGPRVRTVVDVGGKDIKVIRCNEIGKVVNFLVSDRCAAGTGVGLESLADRLGVTVSGPAGRQAGGEEDPPPVSNACVVRMWSEASEMLRKGLGAGEIYTAFLDAFAGRIQSLLDRFGVEPDLCLTGGMAKNLGIMERLAFLTGFDPVEPAWDPQLAGAVGAALFGYTLCMKGKGGRRPGAS